MSAESRFTPDVKWLSGIPVYFSSENIALQTKGFTVFGADCRTQRGTGKILWYSLHGAIHPVDTKAPDIHFQVNLPVSWNGTAIQYGGAGFDGALECAEGPCAGQHMAGPSPVQRGYVTFGSDGGHMGMPGTKLVSRGTLSSAQKANYFLRICPFDCAASAITARSNQRCGKMREAQWQLEGWASGNKNAVAVCGHGIQTW